MIWLPSWVLFTRLIRWTDRDACQVWMDSMGGAEGGENVHRNRINLHPRVKRIQKTSDFREAYLWQRLSESCFTNLPDFSSMYSR
jgi:hypothetical protein